MHKVVGIVTSYAQSLIQDCAFLFRSCHRYV